MSCPLLIFKILISNTPTDGKYRLQVTADISHWVVVCERLLDQGEEDQEILTRFIPHVCAIIH
jgi:hypothetical protein